jgi:hypothetical protein
LLVNNCYKYIKCTKLISDHEIPLAICLLKGILCVSTHCNTGLLSFNSMSSIYWACYYWRKKIQPVLLFNNCYKYIKCTKLISDHEIPLAICLLKGISCVSTHYNTGLLLFNSMSSNYWAIFTGEKNTACFAI